jgi:branched-chain amino acid transport system substrate-binding protein
MPCPRHRPARPHLIVARCLAALTLLAGVGNGAAQGQGQPAWVVGVIVSTSAGSPLGAQQARVAEFAAAAHSHRGVFGAQFVVDVRDDGGDPRRAEAVARSLLDQGALALVCCTTAAASERVSALADEAGVVLLALGDIAVAGRWTLPLRADTRTQLTAVAVHAAEQGKHRLALMTIDNAFGAAAEEAFERALADAGRELAGTVRYAPSASVLTPEALWAATREPGAIVAWGLVPDTALALDGLRRRGWLGPTYVRPEALPEAIWKRLRVTETGPSAPPAPGDVWWQVRSPATPVSVALELPDEHPNRDAALAARERMEVAGVRPEPIALTSVALIDDALTLVQRAFEEVAALGLPPSLPLASLRQAVLDALVSAPARPLAAGTYDGRAGHARFARWPGLVIVTVE